MSRIIVLLLVLVLAACAAHEPPVATGPWHQMNVGKWSFSDNALTDPPAGFAQ